MTTPHAPDPAPEAIAPDPRLLTPEEAAIVLRVSRTTVYAMVRDGELRPFRMRGRTFLHRDELDSFLSRAPRKRARAAG